MSGKHSLPVEMKQILVNAFVGAMIGMERSTLPQLTQEESHLLARTAILSFIVCSVSRMSSPAMSRSQALLIE